MRKKSKYKKSQYQQQKSTCLKVMAMPKVEKKQQQMFISLKKPKWMNMTPNWQMNTAITKQSKEKSRDESTGSAINRVTKITDEHTIIDWDLQKDLNYCECQ